MYEPQPATAAATAVRRAGRQAGRQAIRPALFRGLKKFWHQETPTVSSYIGLIGIHS